MAVVKKIWVLLIGWTLLVGGIILMPLPGPGLLILLSGLIVLSQEYEWAERRLGPVKEKAIGAAKTGVQSWWRILLSALGGLWLIGVGIVWWYNPTIPTWWVFGPRLPFAGWGAGTSLIFSGVVALGLLGYSIKRWRREPLVPAEPVRH